MSLSNLEYETKTVSLLCDVVDTPVARLVSQHIRDENWAELVAMRVDPTDYQDPQHFADDYLVVEAMRKSPSIPLGVDRKQVTLDAFRESEEWCRMWNDEFLAGRFPPWWDQFRNEIYRILGPLDEVDLQVVEAGFAHGPGRTIGTPGQGSVPSLKYDVPTSLSSKLTPYAHAIMGVKWRSYQELHGNSFDVVDYDVFFTVRKNAETDRGCCYGAELTQYFQLGVGSAIRRRLRLSGCDLRFQERNQIMASEAYRRGLATIDLRQASDTNSWGLTFSALPPRWFHLLDLGRVDYVKLPDEEEPVAYEKFSAMGNGFTFPLESLLFLACVRTHVPKDRWCDCSVYGDDIICPQEYAPAVVTALKAIGFKVNESKSCLAGSFFESCGTDWFKSYPVRPFYLNRDGKHPIPYPVHIANALRLYASRVNFDAFSDARWRPVWSEILTWIPEAWRECKVPMQYGDVGIITSLAEAAPAKAHRGWEGWRFRCMTVPTLTARRGTEGPYIVALARLSNSAALKEIGEEDPSPILNWEKHNSALTQELLRRGIAPPELLRKPLSRHMTKKTRYGEVYQTGTLGFESRRGLFGRTVPMEATTNVWPEGVEWAVMPDRP